MLADHHEVRSRLYDRKIIVSCGTGGVGKTSVSAAIALALAAEGKRVGLITIDPAKRLATALGLEDLSHRPQNIDDNVVEIFNKIYPDQTWRGSLDAMMFDSKETLDRFVRKTAGDEVMQELASNRLYQVISDSFSGAHDYLAMEMLFDLHSSQNYDVIVLDTPPARHVLDFLDAPKRIAAFLDDRIFQWFLVDPKNDGFFEKLRARSTKTALTALEWLTGKSVMADFTQLAPHLYKLKHDFMDRQDRIMQLLMSERAGALFVTSPGALGQHDFLSFRSDAKNRGLDTIGLIVNRSLQHLVSDPWEDLSSNLDPDSKAEAVWRYYRAVDALVRQEKRRIDGLNSLESTPTKVAIIPELLEDVHSVESLLTISYHLGYHQ